MTFYNWAFLLDSQNSRCCGYLFSHFHKCSSFTYSFIVANKQHFDYCLLDWMHNAMVLPHYLCIICPFWCIFMAADILKLHSLYYKFICSKFTVKKIQSKFTVKIFSKNIHCVYHHGQVIGLLFTSIALQTLKKQFCCKLSSIVSQPSPICGPKF